MIENLIQAFKTIIFCSIVIIIISICIIALLEVSMMSRALMELSK